jgi:hypothetical protein
MSNENWQNNVDKLAGLQGSENAVPPAKQYYEPPTAQASPPQMASSAYPSASVGGLNSQPQNGMGTASLVLGIIGMVPFPVTGFWCSLLAIIFGAKGRGRANQGLATNKVMATWGMWLGIVGMGVQALLSFAIAFG